jgi:isoleucyl-tRNA synthetase
MWAPIIPFIREEIYQNNFKKFEKKESVHLCSWPKFDKNLIQDDVEDEKWNIFIEIIGNIRQEKSNNQKSMNSEIKLFLTEKQMVFVKEMLEDLKNVSGAVEINSGEEFNVEFI